MSTMMVNPLAAPPDLRASVNHSASAISRSTANTAPDTAATAAGGSATSADSLSTSFLQLLIAQLQNQDPENPVDGTTFVTQLAQFTSVQQQAQSTTDLDSILSLMQQAAANPAAPTTGGTTSQTGAS